MTIINFLYNLFSVTSPSRTPLSSPIRTPTTSPMKLDLDSSFPELPSPSGLSIPGSPESIPPESPATDRGPRIKHVCRKVRVSSFSEPQILFRFTVGSPEYMNFLLSLAFSIIGSQESVLPESPATDRGPRIKHVGRKVRVSSFFATWGSVPFHSWKSGIYSTGISCYRQSSKN